MILLKVFRVEISFSSVFSCLSFLIISNFLLLCVLLFIWLIVLIRIHYPIAYNASLIWLNFWMIFLFILWIVIVRHMFCFNLKWIRLRILIVFLYNLLVIFSIFINFLYLRSFCSFQLVIFYLRNINNLKIVLFSCDLTFIL